MTTHPISLSSHPPQGANVTYNLKDKFFWCVFLNLARHNTYVVLRHISRLLEIPKIDNDEYIAQLKSSWKNATQTDLTKKAKLQDLIHKHFPFLEEAVYGEVRDEDRERRKQEKGGSSTGKNEKLRKATPEEQQNVQEDSRSFERWFELLFRFLEAQQQLRNYYSHHRHPKSPNDPVFDQSFIERLYDIFDASIRRVKEDFAANPAVDAHSSFDHLVRKGKKGIEKKGFRYKLCTKERTLTESGLLFFTALFLSKQDSMWMQKKVRGFKNAQEAYQQMTNEVFCRRRMLIPKLRLEATHTDVSIQFDMLNELIRCPKSLYDRLAEKDKKLFHVPVEDFDDDANNENPFQNKLLRHQNRFPYFALHFLDIHKILPTLRFQVDLGCYHFSIYDKKIGDQTEKRHLTRHLYGFERIQEFSTERQPEGWKKMVKDLDVCQTSDLPFISHTHPHYHLEQEKIGLRFIDPQTHPWPSLEVKPQSPKKDKYNAAFTADAFLSVHELLPMMFYYFLLRKQYGDNVQSIGQKLEGVLISKRRKIFSIYEEFAKGSLPQPSDFSSFEEWSKWLYREKEIHHGHLPQRLLEILKNDSPSPEVMAKKAKEKIAQLRQDTQQRIERFEEQREQKVRIGKRRAGVIQVGKLADWLVRDMMRFQPVLKDKNGQPLNNSKANSTEHQLLQRTFALFEGERHRLPAYFQQLHLINSENPHPFLAQTRWEEATNLLSLYHNYLKAKDAYLKSLSPDEWEKHQHFLLLKAPKTNRHSLVESWKKSFNFPRGLFTQAIKEWFDKKYQDTDLNRQIQALGEVGFTPKAIALYFKEIHEDDSQPFYALPFNVNHPQKPKDAEFLSKEDRVRLWQVRKQECKEMDKQKGKDYTPYQTTILQTFRSIRTCDTETQKAKIANLIQTLRPAIEYKEKAEQELKKDYPNWEEIKKDLQEGFQYAIPNFRAWQKFERELRMYQHQDMLIWWMCLEIIKQKQKQVEGLQTHALRLCELSFDDSNTSNNPLDQIQTMQIPLTAYVADKRGNVDTSQPILTCWIQEENTKLLKQGNFKRFVHDRRINGLLSFLNAPQGAEPILKKFRLERELELYQRHRLEVAQCCLELEEHLLTSTSALSADNFRIMLTQWSKAHPKLQDAIERLIAIRNAFFHNQYPMRSSLFENLETFDTDRESIPEKDGLNIAAQLSHVVKADYQRLLQELPPL